MASQIRNPFIKKLKLEWVTEARLLLTIALPMIMSHVFIILIEVVDSVMASSLGGHNLAAIAVSNSILYPMILAMIGLAMVLSPVVANHRAKDEFISGNHAMMSMMVIAGVTGALMTLALMIVIKLMPLIGIAPQVIPLVSDYIVARLWGLIPFAIYLVFRFYFEGHAKTSTVMKATGIAFFLNIPLNWILMTGWGIFPQLGIKGIGISASLIEIILCLIMMQQWYRVYYKKYFKNHMTLTPTLPMIKRLLKLGIPSSLAFAGEVGMFAIMGIALSRISPVSIAAHQIALSVSAVTFIIPLGISGALASRIGFLSGKNNATHYIYRTITIGICTIVAVMGISSAFLWTNAATIAHFYSSDTSIITAAIPLIIIVAIYQLCDGTQVVFNGILKGFHDTQIPMWMVLFSYWVIGFGGGMTLSKLTPQPELGVWYGITCGLIVSAILLAGRVIYQLKKMQISK
jgi:MATE family multidrug resistance protein